ncbi:MAG: hypothetical protein ABI723_17600 [Bacteroidia bacterium]
MKKLLVFLVTSAFVMLNISEAYSQKSGQARIDSLPGVLQKIKTDTR